MCRHTCTNCRADMNQREAENHECPPAPDFTAAAEEAADEAHDRELGPGFNGAYSGNYIAGFERGAEWARDYLSRADQ